MKSIVRRRAGAVGSVLVILCGLVAGCTPAGGDSPTVSGGTPAPITPTVEPTPQLSPEEQTAVDTVLSYIEISDHIGQNLYTADWQTIFTVAGAPATEYYYSLWWAWYERGWHLVGGSEFTMKSAYSAKHDDRGDYFYVRGCVSVEGTYMADASGAKADEPEADSFPVTFTVLRTVRDQYFVIEDVAEEGSC